MSRSLQTNQERTSASFTKSPTLILPQGRKQCFSLTERYSGEKENWSVIYCRPEQTSPL
jgi:hypothetical protein